MVNSSIKTFCTVIIHKVKLDVHSREELYASCDGPWAAAVACPACVTPLQMLLASSAHLVGGIHFTCCSPI